MRFKPINPVWYFIKLKEVFNFLLRPVPVQKKHIKRIDLARDLFVLLIIDFVLSGLLVVSTMFIDQSPVILSKGRELFSPLTMLLIGSTIIPVLEETAFRLAIIFKPVYLAFSGAILTYYIFTKGIYQTYNLDLGDHFVVRAGAGIVMGFIIFFVSQRFADQLKIFWQKNFRYIFYLSVILFGSVHILNYGLTPENILLMPLLTLPQLLGGVVLGYIRVQYGFIYAIVVHGLNNLLPTLLVKFLGLLQSLLM